MGHPAGGTTVLRAGGINHFDALGTCGDLCDGWRERSFVDRREADLSAPAVDVGKVAADVAGEMGDGEFAFRAIRTGDGERGVTGRAALGRSPAIGHLPSYRAIAQRGGGGYRWGGDLFPGRRAVHRHLGGFRRRGGLHRLDPAQEVLFLCRCESRIATELKEPCARPHLGDGSDKATVLRRICGRCESFDFHKNRISKTRFHRPRVLFQRCFVKNRLPELIPPTVDIGKQPARGAA